MSQIFRKDISHSGASEENLKYLIKVIKPSFWLVLLGGVLIMLAAGLWMMLGTNTSTTTITGIYHPTTSGYGEVICFPNISVGKALDEGMEAMVSIPNYSQSKYGHLEGEVSFTEEYVASEQEMFALLEDKSLVAQFYQNAPAICVIVELDKDPSAYSGYKWSNPNGAGLEVKDGTLVTVQIVTSVE